MQPLTVQLLIAILSDLPLCQVGGGVVVTVAAGEAVPRAVSVRSPVPPAPQTAPPTRTVTVRRPACGVERSVSGTGTGL